MATIASTVSYETIWDLAVSLAGRTPDNVPEKESVMLQAFFASELVDLWRKEAWPELSDNLSSQTVTNSYIDNASGSIGDVLGVYTEDPRTTECWERLDAINVADGDGKIYVNTELGTVWLDYQDPCVDLLDSSLVGTANESVLMAVTLPQRFRVQLAYRGAALLLANEDPLLSKAYYEMAQTDLARQISVIKQPWWRRQERRTR